MIIDVFKKEIAKTSDGTDILVYIKPERLNCVFRMKSKSDIRPGDRIFYELGQYTKRDFSGRWVYDSWKGSQMFIEIEDVKDWLENDLNLDDPDYIKHHNFTVHRKAIND